MVLKNSLVLVFRHLVNQTTDNRTFIKLTLKNASGNVSHGHILAHNNDNRSNVTVMIASRSLLQIAILAPAVEFVTREIVVLLL